MAKLLLAEVDEAWVRRRFGREFDTCERLLRFLSDHLPSGTEEESRRSILMIFSRGTLTFRAAVALCGKGYVDQASMLVRSLFEDMVTAYWASINPELSATRMRDQIDHIRLLHSDAVRKHGGDEMPPDLAALEERRKELNREFGAYGEKGWTGKSVFAMLKEVEHLFGETLRDLIWSYHDIAHRYNSQILHVTAGALSRTLLEAEGGGAMRLRATPAALHGEVEPVLFRAYLLYGSLGRLVIEEQSPGADEYRELFTRDLVALARAAAQAPE